MDCSCLCTSPLGLLFAVFFQFQNHGRGKKGGEGQAVGRGSKPPLVQRWSGAEHCVHFRHRRTFVVEG